MPPDSAQLRFVVLHHAGIPDPHFDLMFELEPGGKLATWRSLRWPIDQPTDVCQLESHRREYLEYEGEISGGRGSVRRVAQGLYQRSEEGPTWHVQFIQPADLPSVILKPAQAPHWKATLRQ